MNFPEYKTIFSYSSKLLCLLGLIYQTAGILDAYLQGETLVNIEIEMKINNTLPAITICFPYSLSFKKLSQLNDVYQEQYDTYLEYSENLTLGKNSSTNETDWQKMMQDIYDEVINDVFDQINNFSLDINQVFNIYSIEFEKDHDKYENRRMIVIGFNKENLTDEIGPPIELININKNQFGEWKTEKCFTYFSALDKKWRNSNIHHDAIYATLYFNEVDINLNKFEEFKFAIHSPNTIIELNDENFEYMSLNKSITVTYSQLSTQLLDHKYDTNCFNYDLDYKFQNNNMRSDCLTWCYQEKLNEKQNSRKLFPTGSLYRMDLLTKFQNMSISEESYHSIRNSMKKFNKYCHDKCRKDCSFIYYSPKYVGDIFRSHSEEVKNFIAVDIDIFHSNLPDIFINYLPSISFLSLICDFAGLIGMWLGFSLIQIEEYVDALVKFWKRKSTVLFQINVYNNENPRTSMSRLRRN